MIFIGTYNPGGLTKQIVIVDKIMILTSSPTFVYHLGRDMALINASLQVIKPYYSYILGGEGGGIAICP
jgi:hypothetical protein